VAGVDENFQPYLDYKDGKFQVEIPVGPLPSNCPLDIFLLIALLLHPFHKIRLSVAEALDCPFLGNDKPVDEISDVSAIVRGTAYENVLQSMSRLEKYKEQSAENSYDEPKT
jgi:hypothetical protein